MTKVKKTRNSIANDMRKTEPLLGIGQTANWSGNGIWKSVLRILKKLKIDLNFDPGIPHLVICSRDSTYYYTDIWSATFIALLHKDKETEIN